MNYCTFSVASLVAQNFIGERPKGLQINHNDGNKLNNYASNLEYVTAKENVLHAYKNGLTPSGEKNCNSKLSNKDVLKIRKMWPTKNFTTRQLAKKFKVSSTNIVRIIHRKMWKYI